ncbi:DNA-binding protein [Streptomyces sp. KAI-26]|uniref:helix-turn-helix transcriptional regulator n=1 Tax=Streptomyces sp. KAI-26 TaxID=1169747 RepID=UPI001587691E|nr:DNA-binding protein [Streptomyces sp. KAI-26]NUV89971.1 DNA-binding protein [Streptomyces sp. KAI-26]NUW23985.1 DNA-binding protein [Streptomyces roseoviolaceus]
MVDELLEPKRVQDEYGFHAQTLANWRWMGIGPDYIKISPGRSGRVKYRRSAIEAWLDAQTVNTAGGAA